MDAFALAALNNKMPINVNITKILKYKYNNNISIYDLEFIFKKDENIYLKSIYLNNNANLAEELPKRMRNYDFNRNNLKIKKIIYKKENRK